METAAGSDVVYEISQGILSGVESRRAEEDRFMYRLEEPVKAGTPAEAASFLFQTVFREPDVQEMLVTLNVNSANQITHSNLIYRGQINTIYIRPVEVFRPAIITNSPGLLLAHNHPSGEPSPSPNDVRRTEELIDVGRLLDIEVLDHLVIGSEGKYTSLKEIGLGFATS